MNAPERHRSYQLDEGQARMTYEPDQRVASAGTFTINKEDHTVGNLLRMQLLRDSDTRFAGYQLPHPLEHVCHVKVETAPGRAPVEVMGGAVTDLRQEVELLDRGFRDECARAREEADARPMET
jgi:DNA-directed RNA polymerase II subunit RPB11